MSACPPAEARRGTVRLPRPLRSSRKDHSIHSFPWRSTVARLIPRLTTALAYLTLLAAPLALAGSAPGKTTESSMPSTQLRSSPSPAQAGKPTTLALRVRDAQGHAVPRLSLSHGKPMHL